MLLGLIVWICCNSIYFFYAQCRFIFQPHVIIHCAAERRPDVVDRQPDVASQLNVVASENLAKEAGKKTFFLH